MLASILLVAIAVLVPFSTAGYVLEDDYSVGNFFSMFDFFTAKDPTNGYVSYVSQDSASSAGMINTNNNAVYMGVDYKNVASGDGRQSVRLTSKKTYTHALIILDVAHMPGGVCGTWPAFWTVGPNWPSGGEIDIIEGVNTQAANSMALHTGSGCSISNNGGFAGMVSTSDCDVNASGQAENAGCQILSSNSASYGSGFNGGQGGVYATEWTSSAIKVWFFPHGAVPSDISSDNPDPDSGNWGQPMSAFEGGCNIDDFFSDHQIVFDTTFCGDWAGNVWSTDPVCGKKANTCEDFVQNNPSAFQDAYWEVNSLKVYQNSGGSTSSSGTTGSGSSKTATAATVPVATTATAGGGGGGLSAVSEATSTATASSASAKGSGGDGGDGRNTRTFGQGRGGTATADTNALVVDATAAAAATATASGVQVQEAAIATDAPATTAAAVVSTYEDNDASEGDGKVQIVTVTALTYEEFPSSNAGNNKAKRASSPPPEPPAASHHPEMAAAAAASNRRQMHHNPRRHHDGRRRMHGARDVHRHLAKRGVVFEG